VTCKFITAAEAAELIADNAVLTVSSSSGLGCPDAVLQAIGERFRAEASPANLTTLHPIAAGDSSGVKGIDHLAQPGLLARTICGSYPSAPSTAPPPKIWQMLAADQVAAYNVPSGILFDMHREAAAHRPGVLTQVGLDTFADPALEGCAMNPSAAANPIVRRVEFDGREWLYFPAIVPDVAIIRATSADARGNLSFEHEGAYLGTLEQALAARNSGGVVIAQVKRAVAADSRAPQQVHVPGVLVDFVPLLDFKFGCASNAEAFVPSPQQFCYFQGGGFDASLLSFLQIDQSGAVNVSRLNARPHVTAGAGGFVDITARARRIVFAGLFNVGAQITIDDGELKIEREGKALKFVDAVDQVSFSGRRAVELGQQVTYITERCVLQLTPRGLLLTEVAPGHRR